MKKKYVIAYPGRRDAYQLPIALAEQGRLAAFATCFYRGRGLVGGMTEEWGFGARFWRKRHSAAIPSERVSCLEFTSIFARLARRLLQPSRVAVWEDLAFARAAVRLARETKANLLLYEFQADWGFRQLLPAGTVKVLFQFHPHPDLEHPLLLADGVKYPELLPGIRRNTRTNLSKFYQDHTRGSWRHADHVIVASRYTAHSLEVAGCPTAKISVVPYGCAFDHAACARAAAAHPKGKPYFLFVGSGSHHKGLHHLLAAWTSSRARERYELIVVARVVAPELQARLAATPAVRHLWGVPQDQLSSWFAAARAFVLPSLSEGFGHVFLEALTCGCPIIGTTHSMLPDFEGAKPHIRYIEPGNPDSIRWAIDDVALMPADDQFFNVTSILGSVRAYTWQRFRNGIEAVLAGLD